MSASIPIPLNPDGSPTMPNRRVLTDALRTCSRYKTRRDFPGDGSYFFIVSVFAQKKQTDYRIGPGTHPEQVIQAAELMAHEAGRYHG